MSGVKRVILENLSSGNLTKQEALEALEALDAGARTGPTPSAPLEEIAIIGMAGTVTMAEDLDQFWDNIVNNRNCFVSKPAERLVEDRVWANPHYAELFERRPHEDKDEDLERFVGPYLPSTTGFDEKFFGISPEDADTMDPQHRVFLQQAWRALEDAGYSERTVRGSRTGVFAGRDGTSSNIYRRVIETDNVGGIWEGILSSRINYEYDLRGPAYVIDTACSSSLVAIHMAAQALRNDECTMAIAGGVCLTAGGLDHDEVDLASIRQRTPAPGNVVSKHFTISTFDAKADGTVFGEGAAAIILKKLSDAERDGDHVYGVIAATATNSDGASNGLTAPNPRAQSLLLADVWERAGINPEHIDYIEAHGTGTTLGDPIEILGISNAFKRVTDRRQFCGIGSLKTNIGHTAGAAGVMSIIKLLLSMREELIPATRNFEEPNGQIDFVDSPVYVVDRNTPWPKRDTPRYAGASAFGFSGTNAHVLLREYQGPAGAPVEIEPVRPRLFTVSAKTETAFENYLARYEEYFDSAPVVSLRDLCFTASTGRDHFEYRLAIVATSVTELATKFALLRESGNRANPAKGIVIGRHRVVSERTSTLEQGDIRTSEWNTLSTDVVGRVADRARVETATGLAEIARDYIRGADVDFASLFAPGSRRVPLPTYPFDRNVHWGQSRVTRIEPERTATGDPVSMPLLHRRLVSTEEVTVYETTLDHSQWAITDHKILGQYFVAGTVLLELAAEALSDHFGTDALQLDEVLFLAPVLAQETVPMAVQVVLQQDRAGAVRIRIASRPAGSDQDWTSNVTGLGRSHAEQPPVPVRAGKDLDGDPDLTAYPPVFRNVEFGPRWKNLVTLWRSADDPDVAYGFAELPAAYRGTADHKAYVLHPGLIDCTVSMVPFVTWLRPRVFLPMTYRNMTVYRSVPDSYYVKSERLPSKSEELMSFRTVLFTETGEVIAEIEQFAMKRVTELNDFVSGSLSRLSWTETPRSGPAAQRTGAILAIGAPEAVLTELATQAPGRTIAALDLSVLGADAPLTQETVGAALRDVDLAGVSDVLDFSSYAPARGRVSEADLDRGVTEGLDGHVTFLQALFASAKTGLDLVVVVDNAHSVTGTERYVDAVHTAKAAVVQSVRHEVPNIGFGVLDVDDATPVETVVAEALSGSVGPLTALRGGDRYTARLVEIPLEDAPTRPVTIKPHTEGFYLVTGGLGSLGSATALILSHQSDQPIAFALSSRRNHLPPRDEWASVRDADPSSRTGQILTSLLELVAGGHIVRIVEMDVSGADAVAGALDPLRAEFGPLLGIVHAAGVAGDGYLFTKSTAEFQRVLAPKVSGLRNLVAWTGDARPDFIVSYSSMTAVIGGAGQSDYAAANAFLDGYTQQLRRDGYNASSINWPGWSERGMAVDAGLGANETFFEHLTTGSGVTAFIELLTRDVTGTIPSRPNIAMLARVGEDYFAFDFSDPLRRSVRRHVARLSSASPSGDVAVAPGAPELGGRSEIDVSSISIMGKADEHLDDVERAVAYTFASVLSIEEIHVNDSFTAMGGNSIAATELMRALNAQFDDLLNISDIFSYNSPAELSGRIIELGGAARAPASALSAPADPQPTTRTPTPAPEAPDYDDMVDALERGDIDAASLREFLAKEL